MATNQDDLSTCKTSALILKGSRKHYETAVRSYHWQLRSLISVDKHRLCVYFPSGSRGSRVKRLDIKTLQCLTIKVLSFAPQCLVAENGWICCGGDSGEFTAIRADEVGFDDETVKHAETPAATATSPGTTPPADITDFGTASGTVTTNNDTITGTTTTNNDTVAGTTTTTDTVTTTTTDTVTGTTTTTAGITRNGGNPTAPPAGRAAHKNLAAKVAYLAGKRINCITLWSPPGGAARDQAGLYKGPVAVLANNDKYVTVISLHEFETRQRPKPLEVIRYPDCVNRALLSPDGRILVAILDDPYLYVHVRAPGKKSGCPGREVPSDEADDESSGRNEFHWTLANRILLESQNRDDLSQNRGSFAACFSPSGSALAVGTQYGTVSIFDAALLPYWHGSPLLTTLQSSRPGNPLGAIRDMAFSPGGSDLLAWTEDRGRICVVDVRAHYALKQTLDINDKEDFEDVKIASGSATPSPPPPPREQQDEGPGAAEGPGAPVGPGDPGRRTNRIRTNLARRPERPGNQDGPATSVLQAARDERRRRRAPQPSQGIILVGERQTPRDAPTSDNSGRNGSASRNPGTRGGPWPFMLDNPADLPHLIPRVPLAPLAPLAPLSPLITLELLDPVDQDLLGPSDTAIHWFPPSDFERSQPNARDVLQVYRTLAASWRRVPLRLQSLLEPFPRALGSLSAADNTAGLAWSQDGLTLFVGAENGIYEFRVNAHQRQYFPSFTFR